LALLLRRSLVPASFRLPVQVPGNVFQRIKTFSELIDLRPLEHHARAQGFRNAHTLLGVERK
jgi:hypothetical protein